MKKLLAVLMCLCLMNNVFSQSTTSKEQKIKELMDVTGSGKLGAQITHQLLSTFQAQFTDVPAEFWEKMKAEINADEIVNLCIPVYAKFYTEDEIVALLQFYKTPIGQKVIQVTPQLMQESMQVGRAWGQKLTEKIVHELTEKGYKKEVS